MKPSQDLYHLVRSVFARHDSSLAEWCRAKGIPFTTMRGALTGDNMSKRAQELRKRVLYVTGLDDTEEA